ncbi:hypothetical protein ACYATP_02605 [Lactobacillaceae bacterium Melli_B4]
MNFFASFIFTVSLFVAAVSFFILKKGKLKNEDNTNNFRKAFLISGAGLVISVFLLIYFPSTNNNSNNVASESSIQTSKEARSSSAKAAKDSSKAASSEKDKKDLELAESMASSLKDDQKPKFAKSIGNLVETTQGKISNSVVKNDIIYITLDDSVTDNDTEIGLRNDCNTIYHSVNDIAAKHGLDTPSMFIYDSGNNTVAKNTAWGGYKYIGLGK